MVDGLNEWGEARCCDAKTPHADVWRLIWWKINDIGPGITFHKCKSHQSKAAVGLLDDRLQLIALGNELADQHAKAGAAIDQFDLIRARTYEKACAEVKDAMVYIGSFVQEVQPMMQQAPVQEQPQA